jgi:DNA-binding transcriptional MerR regulator
MDKSPDAFRTISEVADHLDTPAHVLRFWETRFPQIRPVKRAGGRRYYRPSDVALLTGIKRLLHDDGLTIRGVQKILREQGVRHVAGLTAGDGDAGKPLDHVEIIEDVGEEVAPLTSAAVVPLVNPDVSFPTAGDIWPDATLAPADDAAAFVSDLSDPVVPTPEPVAETAMDDADDDQFLALLAEVSRADDDAAPDLDPDVKTDDADLLIASVIDVVVQTAPSPPSRSDDTWRSIPLAAGEEMPLSSRARALPTGALAPRRREVSAWIARAQDLTRRMGQPVGPGHR